MNTRYFPSPDGRGTDVLWNGREFEGHGPVLCYPMPNNPEGWDDSLTDFHEEVSQGHLPIDEASFSTALERVKRGLRARARERERERERERMLLFWKSAVPAGTFWNTLSAGNHLCISQERISSISPCEDLRNACKRGGIPSHCCASI